LNGLKLDTNVFIAPAGYFAQLLYYFIKKNNPHIKILGFLDNDTSKHGTRVYGTSILTHPMNYIEIFRNTTITIIMNKSPYYNEIKEQLMLYHTNINFISISLK
jgi:FlaA1/EpsC-like NDP-sugar epimerase